MRKLARCLYHTGKVQCELNHCAGLRVHPDWWVTLSRWLRLSYCFISGCSPSSQNKNEEVVVLWSDFSEQHRYSGDIKTITLFFIVFFSCFVSFFFLSFSSFILLFSFSPFCSYCFSMFEHTFWCEQALKGIESTKLLWLYATICSCSLVYLMTLFPVVSYIAFNKFGLF
jgi:hypothetical protein